MTIALSDSYAQCEHIARSSGSSFYRSFALLGRDRRNAITALYAFARLADDATDDAINEGMQESESWSAWSAPSWHEWLDSLSLEKLQSVSAPSCLAPIRMALAESVSKFAIPIETLHDIVRGVDSDVGRQLPDVAPQTRTRLEAHPPIRMKNWEETSTYCYRVASSVGIACLSIWAKNIGEPPTPSSIQAAANCGVAFQMTNILRDIAEDSQRNRIYLPQDELARNGIDSERWLGLQKSPTVFALNEMGDWRGLIRVQLERTKALYERGWQVANSLSLDGQRMFSLMWHSYRQLLATIEKKPEMIWQSRLQLTRLEKSKLVFEHFFTPSFQRLLAAKKGSLESSVGNARFAWPTGGPRIAVVGAGLAGINAGLQLARHGCKVMLFESKHRIGGRVGSFVDSESGQSVDYCQHVGMNCCSTLKQWIADTDQSPYWTEQKSLHFVSSSGKRIRVAAWPLPAPLHLAGLLFRWPQLQFRDRIRVGIGLLRLNRLKRTKEMSSELAMDWLRANGQSEMCMRNFWSTILVSALGEQVERITLGAAHKVLIDGFAASRTAFHLLVPNRPLSKLLDESVAGTLRSLGVDIRLGHSVNRLQLQPDGRLSLDISAEGQRPRELFDAAVCAVPWNRVSDCMPSELISVTTPAASLQSSPITGIHTWWDRPWLNSPHAILVDRLCQWIFPAPNGDSILAPRAIQNKEYYYQIIVSASLDLPRGDSESILKMVKRDLAEIFPESAVATMFRGKVVTDPNAVFSMAPGMDSSRLRTNACAEHRIWLAGDWTQSEWPATMEGALRSGARAAQELLCTFGRPVSIVERSQ